MSTPITPTDWAEAEWIEQNYLNEGDKKIILRVQRYAELLHKHPESTFMRARIESTVSLLANRLKVSEPVANALSCFEVA